MSPGDGKTQAAGGAAPTFSALLTPYRSLGKRGFLILMCAMGAVSFAAGFAFLLIGAWPVLGFFGLDVAIVYCAFKLNYRAGRLYETVDLTGDALTVTRVQPSGASESWSFHPYWVRVGIEQRPGRPTQLSLASHGKTLVLGVFLTDGEREDFAFALKRALAEASGGASQVSASA